MSEPIPQDRLLRISQVKEMTGLGKSMIYRMIGQGRFPKQFKPGGAASRWSETEVQAWLDKVRAERAA